MPDFPQGRVSRETREAVAAHLAGLGGGHIDTPRDVERLAGFAELLREVAVPRGFVAEGDRGRVLDRHVLDSLRAAPAIRERREIADLGSGAGLPGIPLAIVRPDANFTLIESRPARGAFLELAVERLGLDNVEVVVARVEDLVDRAFGAATARAFAPLDRAWQSARRVLAPGGRLIVFAGQGSRIPESLPDAASVVSERAVLESQGPLIIITR